MELAYTREMLEDYLQRVQPEGEIFLDRFLEDAIEVDVDAICDGEDVWIGGIMQHVEEAGIHSGDSACVLPPHSLGGEMLDEIRTATRALALALGVVGLINVQYGIYGEDLYVIEANPRASRTVPFVSKATGLPLAKLACRVMLGEKLASMRLPEHTDNGHVSVKEAVLPFDRFAGVDALLGPEMRSTGEVMGVAVDFPTAFAKAQAAAGAQLPSGGTVFLTVTDSDKAAAVGIAAQLHDLGFRIVATRGTAAAIKRMGVPVETLNKVQDGSPHVVDWIENGDVDLVINTPTGTAARSDGYEIRRAAVARGVPCITTLAGGTAAARAIARRADGGAAGAVAAGAPRRRGPRMIAPLGRRLVEVSECRRVGAYLVLSAPDPHGPAPDPGQFYMLATAQRWGGGEAERPFLPRAFSVLRAARGTLEFMLEEVGPGTRRLGELRAGDGLWLAGPFGNGFAPAREGRRPLLVGGGVGIAPLAIFQDALGAEALVCSAFATPTTPRARRCCDRARIATDDGSVGHAGPVTDLLLAELGSDPHVEVYACGPPGMLESVRAICTERAIPAQLAMESGMACGYGACFGCVVATKAATCACASTVRCWRPAWRS